MCRACVVCCAISQESGETLEANWWCGSQIICLQENITHYLSACQVLGFQPGELFDTTDLYEDKDMMRVRDGPSPNNPLPPFFASCCISLAPWRARHCRTQVLQNVNVLRKFSEKFDSAAVRYDSSLQFALALAPSLRVG